MTVTKTERLKAMVNEITTEDDGGELPEFGGYQMAKAHGPVSPEGTFYTDRDGHIWFDTESDSVVHCFGEYEDKFIEAMLRAYFAEGDE